MINNKEKKMIQRYCIYPKIAVVALIFSFVQCALIVPLEMIDTSYWTRNLSCKKIGSCI